MATTSSDSLRWIPVALLAVSVDPDDRCPESDETNNAVEGTI